MYAKLEKELYLEEENRIVEICGFNNMDDIDVEVEMGLYRTNGEINDGAEPIDGLSVSQSRH